MFSLREFLKNGFIKAVGKMADYQIILNAAGWLEKGVLIEEDLEEIQVAIEAYHAQPETPEVMEPEFEEIFDEENEMDEFVGEEGIEGELDSIEPEYAEDLESENHEVINPEVEAIE